MFVYLPRWAAQLARRRRPSDSAFLLIDAIHGVQVVAACCDLAELAGVRPGMSLVQARIQLSGRSVDEQPHAPAEDAARLRQLAAWAHRYSPVVSPQPPDGLFLDVSGCAALFGGEQGLGHRLLSRLKRQGLEARAAITPTFGAAWALARWSDAPLRVFGDAQLTAAIDPLPTAALRLDEAVIAALAEVGIERIGQLRRMPRHSLVSRLGKEALRRLDQMTGLARETPESVPPPVVPEALRVFDGATTNWEGVLLTAHELLAELTARLAREGLGISDLRLKLSRLSDRPVLLRLRLTHASQESRHLWSLLRPRLERVCLGYGVEEIRLWAARVEPVEARQSTLWRIGANAGDARATGELLDRLIDRLGRSAIHRMQPRAAFFPEDAFAPKEVLPPAHRKEEVALWPALRPAAFFDVPEPAQAIALLPDGPPNRVRWRGRLHEIHRAVGPERLAPPWWTPRRRGRRDYYGVEDAAGRWLWIFRDAHGRWFVHGVFA